MALRWSRGVVYLGLAIGLVLMHHVVGAHQHGPAEPRPTRAPEPAAAAPVSAHASPLPMPALQGHHDGHGVAMPAPESSAALHHHPSGGDDQGTMTMLLHMCLAVLAAAAALGALSLIGSWWRAALLHRPVARVLTASLARPPPVPLRLAQLQILRL